MGEEGGIEGQKKEISKRNNKLVKSPVGKRIREEMRDFVRKLGEELIAEVREGMKVIRKATRDQKMLKKEVERIKKEWKSREEKWNKEREEFKGRIEKIEGELERMRIGRMEKEGRKRGERKIRIIERGKRSGKGRSGRKRLGN